MGNDEPAAVNGSRWATDYEASGKHSDYRCIQSPNLNSDEFSHGRTPGPRDLLIVTACSIWEHAMLRKSDILSARHDFKKVRICRKSAFRESHEKRLKTRRFLRKATAIKNENDPKLDQMTPNMTRTCTKHEPNQYQTMPGIETTMYYLQEPGSFVGKRSEHLIIKKEGHELNRVPIPQVRQVVVFGNVQISTQALETLAYNEIPVIYLTGYGRFVAALQPAPAKNMALREAQYKRFANAEDALLLSKAVVRAKLTNQRTLLMRSLRDGDSRGSDEPAARDLAELLYRLDAIDSLESLLGIEGQGAALYFGEFNRFLKAQPPGQGFEFRNRNRRPPRDPVNALLSFAYALLAKDCFSALCTVGFDPYRGFFHSGRHGRPSLALDLMEEFRAVIADSVVLTLINTRAVTPEDFITWGSACQLTEAGRKKFFQSYEHRKSTLVQHPLYGYRMSYSRMLEVQARMLAGFARGELPHYTGFIVR